MNKTPRVLGILGGLGPMASVYFYELLTKHTKAARDQDHIDVIINSRATTPDRTAYILGQSTENPFDIMEADAHRLVTFGAEVLAIPCNTAHYFYDKLEQTAGVPILNMVEQTVLHVKQRGVKKPALLATTGTVAAKTYQRMFEKHGMAFAVPDEKHQNMVMRLFTATLSRESAPTWPCSRPWPPICACRAATAPFLAAPSFRSSSATSTSARFLQIPWRCFAAAPSRRSGKTPIGFEED